LVDAPSPSIQIERGIVVPEAILPAINITAVLLRQELLPSK